MNLGEKPLVTVLGRPMISYVISAFMDAGYEILVVVSQNVPMTRNWCRANNIDFYQSKGNGYIEDLVDCITEIGVTTPFFTCVADVPGIRSVDIERIRDLYEKSDLPACSVWVPKIYFSENNCKCSYYETVDGVVCCPAGVNVLDGKNIAGEQEELKVLLDEPALAFNVNTREELLQAENYFKKVTI
nr:NTP transferase domain-containing protein [Methanomicrobium sp. W14]